MVKAGIGIWHFAAFSKISLETILISLTRPSLQILGKTKTWVFSIFFSIDDGVMSANCDVIVIFPIYGQFGAIWKPDSGRIVCEIYIFIDSNLVLYKNGKKNIFCKKKNADISKTKGALVLKLYFLKLDMCVYLRTKFQVSSVILTSFRQGWGVGGNPPPNP